MPKAVTFGELMIQLQPYNYERFVQAGHLEFTFGGGEACKAAKARNIKIPCDLNYRGKL